VATGGKIFQDGLPDQDIAAHIGVVSLSGLMIADVSGIFGF
jgi:hypothetical protein